MPRTGRPPKPVELKRRLGNPGKRPLAAPVTVLPGVSQASALIVPDTGDAMLQRLLDTGASTWIGPTDAAAAQRARELWDDVALARLTWRQTQDPSALNAYEKLNKGLIACLSSLGLDPTSRSRLGVAEVKTRSKLEELAARREARTAGRRSS
jgi:hypothetical protein